ncbi:MAG: hypothetical protein VCE91_02365 [Nitrospinota bacterium]
MGVDITSITDTNGDALNAPPPASSPDPGFSRLLDSATGQKPSIEESPKTAEMAKFNLHNLLNGQFPPPDSGAGILYSHISLNNGFS